MRYFFWAGILFDFHSLGSVRPFSRKRDCKEAFGACSCKCDLRDERSLAQPAGMRNCWSHARVLSLEVEMVRNEKSLRGIFMVEKVIIFAKKSAKVHVDN